MLPGGQLSEATRTRSLASLDLSSYHGTWGMHHTWDPTVHGHRTSQSEALVSPARSVILLGRCSLQVKGFRQGCTQKPEHGPASGLVCNWNSAACLSRALGDVGGA